MVVVIDGGCISEVVSSETISIRIIDRDIEGAEPEDLHIINGKKLYVYNGIRTAVIAPEQTANIFSQISKSGVEVWGRL